jgi:hypothetical protein
MKMGLAGRVPQIFNLLYRRVSVGKTLDRHGHRAGCKPAIRQITNLRHIFWSDAMPRRVAPQTMKMGRDSGLGLGLGLGLGREARIFWSGTMK